MTRCVCGVEHDGPCNEVHAEAVPLAVLIWALFFAALWVVGVVWWLR